MGKSAGSAPQSPAPERVAAAQTTVNRDAALYNAALNRINTYTPYGSQTYNVTGTDPRTGAPIYSQTTSLSPDQQAILDQQNQQTLQAGGVASQLLDNVGGAYTKPIDTSNLYSLQNGVNTSNLPQLYGTSDLNAARTQAQDAVYANNTRYLDQQFSRDEASERSRLANQGIVEGSEAYNNAMNRFNQNKETAYQTARNDAVAQGGQEMSRLFDISSQGRQQLYGEQANNVQTNNALRDQQLSELFSLRNQPLNEYNALRSGGQVANPQFDSAYQAQAAPADITGSINQQYQGQLNQYNQNVATANSNNQAAAASVAAIIAAFSDERLKKDVHKVGELPDETNIYSFKYKGSEQPQIGVMAQEVEKKDPKAVTRDPASGMRKVNYARVMAKALAA